MNQKPIEILKTFDINTIPNLDVAVLAGLELFQRESLPKLDLDLFKRPLVVGSGNAEATGRIIFRDQDAIFASESDYLEKLERFKAIDGLVLISASGEKDAQRIAKTAKRLGKPVNLLTNRADSSAVLELNRDDKIQIFPKNREPYSYNVSSYLGMILNRTGERPAEIKRFIEAKIQTLLLPDLSSRKKFFLVVPARFVEIKRMLEIKFIELFGREISRDIETADYLRHGTTIVLSDELFISFGEENKLFGRPENRFRIPLPENADYGAMMAIGYWFIGQIQKDHKPYFKDSLVGYVQEASRLFGQKFSPIVE